MAKAISLLSGGLDSILATRLILDQGIEVEALNFSTTFYAGTASGNACLASKTAADRLGVKLNVFEVSKEYFGIIKSPKYGYGSNMNPCIDCRIFMLRKAAEYMKSNGASFLVTGEVLGERPMSQRREAMRIIERDSGLEGLILRPLSAKLMEPTIPEKEGLVDRERLLAIEGRSRKPQMQLASQLGIDDYSSPAGGCLLTDPGFAKRMRDLMDHKADFTINDVQFLKTGRHFRLTPEVKLIVGRNKDENNRLLKLTQEGDLCFNPVGVKGPIGIGKGKFNQKSIADSCRIIARYSDGRPDEEVEIAYKRTPNERLGSVTTVPMEAAKLDNLRV